VVSVGRLDPLKDAHTMLRVAAETVGLMPGVQFLHFGPVPRGEEVYGRSCVTLHEQLGLGDRFRFMGPTTDPKGVVRDADVVLITSISEGLPVAILEAMGQARPVVATRVGGVAEVVRGCGVVCPPGDDHALAMAVVLLLRHPDLAWRLGRRGHRRLGRLFGEAACIDGYRELLHAMVGRPPLQPATTGLERTA
jgi:glycosyltransferase involved in cell wall biosynthesis